MSDKSFYDKHGRQIHKGDLLRTFHFTGTRRKKYFMYHTVVAREGVLYSVPTADLEPTCANQGGTCSVEAIIRSGADIEIIAFFAIAICSFIAVSTVTKGASGEHAPAAPSKPEILTNSHMIGWMLVLLTF